MLRPQNLRRVEKQAHIVQIVNMPVNHHHLLWAIMVLLAGHYLIVVLHLIADVDLRFQMWGVSVVEPVARA